MIKYSPIIAPVALVLGLAGLIFGLVAFQKSSQLDAVSEVKEANSRISENIVGLQEQVVSLGKQYASLANLQEVVDQTREGVQSMSEQLSEVRTQAGSDAARIAELEARLGIRGRESGGESPSPSSSVATNIIGPDALTPAEDGSGRMQYTIQKGDTLDKVARSFGISLDALLQANPGIEPRYLRIGQKVNVPGVSP